MEGFDSAWVIGGGVVFVVLMMCYILWASTRLKRVGPNEALIISGQGRRRIVVDGAAFVWPFIQEEKRLSLEAMGLALEIEETGAPHGGPVTVRAQGQVRVPNDPEWIRKAATNLLDKPADEITGLATQVVEAQLHKAMRGLGAEGVRQAADERSQKAQSAASGELSEIGLQLLSLTITEVR